VEDEIVSVYFKALMLTTADDKFLELGASLHFLQGIAPKYFKMLLDLPEVGRRKGYYLVLVDKAFGKVAQIEAVRIRLKKLGWTKLSVIAPHVTPDNLDELLGLAEQHSVENLKLVLQGEEPIVDGKTVTLRFTKKQFEVFKEAIVKKGAIKSGDGFIRKERALIKALKKG
jgi:hypothetical protein